MKYIFTLFLNCLSYTALIGQAGTLDKSFGNSGKVLSPFFSVCSAIALQPDGKIIAAGDGVDLLDKQRIFLSRFNTDGSLDLSFGDSGRVLTGNEVNAIRDYAKSVAIQPDGKIVAAGSIVTQYYTDIVVVRYNPDGSLDKDFGTNGLTITNIKNYDDAYDITLQEDGKILVTGMSRVDVYDNSTSFLVRYNRDGKLDESFGEKGITLTKVEVYINTKAIALQKDGKIITGGRYGLGFDKAYAVYRYLPNGTKDLTFGANGKGILTFTPDETPNAILLDIKIQDDDKILATGSIGKDTPQLAVARFMANGVVDSSFGTNGYTSFVVPNTFSQGYGLAIQSDKKILAGGLYYDGKTTFGVVRFFADGIIDSSFGVNGVGATGFRDESAPSCMALQQDGQILVGGTLYPPSFDLPAQQAIVRFNNDDNKKQGIITRIKRWLQHRGISWPANNNVRYYTIQRSTDGIVYKEIAKLGNSSSTYEDATALNGSAYYRLTAIAKDGSRTYSNTVLIGETQQVRMFPNPVRDNLQLQGLATGGNTAVSVVDLQGNVRATATAGGGSYSVNTAKLSAGNYILKLQHNGTTTTQPFVKE